MTEKRVSRWYFGGIASCGAACCTHPLDLLKVHLQTQQEVKMRMTGMAIHVVRSDGLLALYNGLSASLLRQMSYSMTRFAIYETARDMLGKANQGPIPFYQKVLLAAFGATILHTSGVCVCVFHVSNCGIAAVSPEGLKKLFSGATMASSRGALVTVGQLSCYDQAKQIVLSTGFMSDNIFTHLLASSIAGGCATFLCQPLDVLKTRLMNSKGEYTGVLHCLKETAKLGPLAFYKGLVPAGIRLVPHTVLTFVFLEQLRKYFGLVGTEPHCLLELGEGSTGLVITEMWAVKTQQEVEMMAKNQQVGRCEHRENLSPGGSMVPTCEVKPRINTWTQVIVVAWSSSQVSHSAGTE
ncbi:mitochondrial dicarboxylate carrier-like [Arapaima gigas]